MGNATIRVFGRIARNIVRTVQIVRLKGGRGINNHEGNASSGIAGDAGHTLLAVLGPTTMMAPLRRTGKSNVLTVQPSFFSRFGRSGRSFSCFFCPVYQQNYVGDDFLNLSDCFVADQRNSLKRAPILIYTCLILPVRGVCLEDCFWRAGWFVHTLSGNMWDGRTGLFFGGRKVSVGLSGPCSEDN